MKVQVVGINNPPDELWDSEHHELDTARPLGLQHNLVPYF